MNGGGSIWSIRVELETGNREIYFLEKNKLKKMKFIISQKYILYHSSMIILKNKTIKSIYKKARFFTPNCSWTTYTVEKSTKSFLSSIHIYSKSFGRFWYKILLKDSKLTRANG